MIKIIIDDSRLKLENRSKSEIGQKNIYSYRMRDAELYKLSLQSHINKYIQNLDLKTTQYIIIKPCKTSNHFIYDLHAISDKKLKALVQRYKNQR